MVKILSDEELHAHNRYLAINALAGFSAGCVLSAALYRFTYRRLPMFRSYPITIKSAAAITPPCIGFVLVGEKASNRYDRMLYKSGEFSDAALKEHQRMSKLSRTDYFLESLYKNKYSVITAAWALSMWGSWEYVNMDKIMTKSQKIVQARMYAQSITVLLVVGAVALSVSEEKRHPEIYGAKPSLNESWKEILKEEEEKEDAVVVHKL